MSFLIYHFAYGETLTSNWEWMLPFWKNMNDLELITVQILFVTLIGTVSYSSYAGAGIANDE